MSSFKRGKPPGPNAGRISPDTVKIRPETGMTEKQEKLARQLCRDGWSVKEIATHFRVPEEKAAVAVATVRTTKKKRDRVTHNGTVASEQYLKREAHPKEPRWKTLDRLFEELEDRRAGRL